MVDIKGHCKSSDIEFQIEGLFPENTLGLKDAIQESFNDFANGPSSWLCFPTEPGKYLFGGDMPDISIQDFKIRPNDVIYEGKSSNFRAITI